jgi:hypothetical protein
LARRTVGRQRSPGDRCQGLTKGVWSLGRGPKGSIASVSRRSPYVRLSPGSHHITDIMAGLFRAKTRLSRRSKQAYAMTSSAVASKSGGRGPFSRPGNALPFGVIDRGMLVMKSILSLRLVLAVALTATVFEISPFPSVAQPALLPTGTVAQQKSLKEQLVGAWGYVSSNATRPDGTSLWGENANGLFILTESEHFSWQVFRSDRPKFASNNRLNATPDELKVTNQGSLAYFGTYSVDEADKTVTFRTQASTFPNSEGEVLKRVVTKLTADELIYTNPATTLGARIEAIWKRVK